MEVDGIQPTVITSPLSIPPTAAVSSSPCPDCKFDFGASQSKFEEPPSSLYAYYSKKNAYPSLHEEKIIKTGIIDALAQVSVISSKIKWLNTAVDLLEKEQERVEGVALKYHSMLRPIHRLPPELLTMIFLFCVDASVAHIRSEGFRATPPSTSLNPSKHPWALSQVCQSWRKLALSTPSLWSFVSFTFPSPDSSNQTIASLVAQSYRLQLQIQRSSNYPTDIITQTPDARSPSLERFLYPLCFNSSSWRHLSIELHGDVFSPWMSCVSGRLQSLESLHVKFIGPLHAELECFHLAPKLTSLVFSADSRMTSDVWTPALLKMPYKQIKHYRWQDMEDDSITLPIRKRVFMVSLRTLCLLQDLESCRLSLHSRTVNQYHSRFTSSKSVQGRLSATFKRVRELELDSLDRESGIHVVLLYFKAPSLKKLNIFSSGPDHNALTGFLIHSQSLVSLSINRVEMSSTEFSAILTCLPLLNELLFGVAQTWGISNDYMFLFRRTDPTTSRFSLVPTLEKLSFLPVGNFASTYTASALIGVLEARWRASTEADMSDSGAKPSARLLSVKLDKGMDDERLDQLRVEGLQVAVWGEANE